MKKHFEQEFLGISYNNISLKNFFQSILRRYQEFYVSNYKTVSHSGSAV
jgi:hypothetical protein